MDLQFAIRQVLMDRIHLIYVDETILVMVRHSGGWTVHVRIEPYPQGRGWYLVGGEFMAPQRLARWEMGSQDEAITWAVRSLGYSDYTHNGAE